MVQQRHFFHESAAAVNVGEVTAIFVKREVIPNVRSFMNQKGEKKKVLKVLCYNFAKG